MQGIAKAIAMEWETAIKADTKMKIEKTSRIQKSEGIDFSKMPCIYWSEETKISYLQRRVIVYSIMYYEFNASCVTDFVYDAIVRQLTKMQKETDEKTLRSTKYFYVFYDFDGSTGFYLYSRLSEEDKRVLKTIAYDVLKLYKKGK